ncbi:hypothetical protein SLA2020_120570 [Shorea laevis]
MYQMGNQSFATSKLESFHHFYQSEHDCQNPVAAVLDSELFLSSLLTKQQLYSDSESEAHLFLNCQHAGRVIYWIQPVCHPNNCPDRDVLVPNPQIAVPGIAWTEETQFKASTIAG